MHFTNQADRRKPIYFGIGGCKISPFATDILAFWYVIYRHLPMIDYYIYRQLPMISCIVLSWFADGVGDVYRGLPMKQTELIVLYGFNLFCMD